MLFSLRFLIPAIVVVLGVQFGILIPFDIYHQLPWLDIPMHFLGGFLAAGVGVVLWKRRAPVQWRYYKRAWCVWGMFVAVGFAIIVGMFWEWFEVGAWAVWLDSGRMGTGTNRWLDTNADYFFDFFGSIVTATIFYFKHR